MVFLCGGPASKENLPLKSCRAIFYHYIKNQAACSFRDNVILAEDIFSYFKHSSYPDLIRFEKDLAELSSLTVLFSESPGSIAELGSFSVLPKVQERLLLVMHEEDASKESFIWRGPALHLKSIAKANGKEDPVSIFNWQKPNKGKNTLTPSDFPDADALSETIGKLLEKKTKTAAFQKDQVGHVMLFVLDLLKVIRLATIEEIQSVLNDSGIQYDRQKVEQHVSLLHSLGYVISKPYQNNTFYLSSDHPPWLSWAFTKGAMTRDLARWRHLFIEHYSKNQIQKHRALGSYMRVKGESGAIT